MYNDGKEIHEILRHCSYVSLNPPPMMMKVGSWWVLAQRGGQLCLHVQVYDHRTPSVPWKHMRGWEQHPSIHFAGCASACSSSRRKWQVKVVEDSPLQWVGTPICLPELLPREIYCLSEAWMWDVADMVLRCFLVLVVVCYCCCCFLLINPCSSFSWTK